MQQEYAQFYRHYGIRKLDQLTAPPMTLFKLFDFPKLSLWHYLGPQDGQTLGPANDEPELVRITRTIPMMNVRALRSTEGPYVKHTVQLSQIESNYFKKHRRFRSVKDLSAYETTGQVIPVVNYSLLPLTCKYLTNAFAGYYRWKNTMATVLQTIGDIANSSVRHQFIHLPMPAVLPSPSQLNQATTTFTSTSLRHLHEPANFMLLEIWKWLSDNRSSSLLNHISPQYYDKVNFVFTESGRFTILNLGVLDQLRRPKVESEINKNGMLTGALVPLRLQRRFLQFLMVIYQNRSVDNKIPRVVADEAKKDNEESTPVKESPQRIVSTDNQGKDQSTILNLNQTDLNTLNSDHSDAFSDNSALSAEMEKTIEHNMQALEDVARHVYALRHQNGVFDEYEHDHVEEPDQESQLKTLHALGLKASSAKTPMQGTRSEPVVEVEHTAIHHNYQEGVMRHVTRLSSQGLLSPAEVKRYEKLSGAYKEIQAPNSDQTLDKFVVLDPAKIAIAEAPKIPDRHTILDKSMLDNTLEIFDSQYIKHSLQRDIAAMVLNLQHAGIVITEYESELDENLMGDLRNYRARANPINGASGTIHFSIPEVDEDGTYMVNGVRYRMRKQTASLPLRKTGPDEVIIASYYGKLIIRRDAKRVNDYGSYLSRAIMDKGFDQSNNVVTGFHPNNVFDPAYTAPRLFTILASNFANFDVSPMVLPEELSGRLLHFVLDHRKFAELNDKYKATFFQNRQSDQSMIGYTNKGERMVVDDLGHLYVNAVLDDGVRKQIALPTLEAMIGLERLNAPVDFAVVKVNGKNVPIGVIFAYYMGLQSLIEFLQVEPRRVPARHKLNLTEHEYTIQFEDETLVLDRRNTFAALLLAGFNEYHRALKGYSVHEFDHSAVYLNLLSSAGLTANYLREIDLLRDLFLEPITREKLIEMKEPHEFIPLLTRAVQLLTTDNHPRVTDGSYNHIKSYERLAGILYRELVDAVRRQRASPGSSKQPLDIHPYAVWQAISEDQAKQPVKDINPIENLKQLEAVTATGAGGVSGRMMARVNRIYDENDRGKISEATVDSADTAVNTYLCASPLFDSVRGTARRYEEGKTGATSLFSTTALLSVAADRDDGKRLNYASIQHGHGVPSKAYHAPSIRTGYEQMVPFRTSDLYAYTARQDGVVKSVNEHGIVIHYADGSKKSIETGRRYGTAEGAVIPHHVVPNVREGQKLKRGDLVSYHPHFFEPDPMNPGHVVWKSSVTVTMVLMENLTTHEDACAISRDLSDRLTTEICLVRDVTVRFDQAVSKMVKLGDTVDVEDILCVLEDATSHANKLYDETSLDTLRILNSHVPTAKTKGVVERIEFHYRGEKEDMSESLRSFANQYDRQLGSKLKALDKTAHTAQTETDYRLEGQALLPNTAVFLIYITAEIPTLDGDKLVFGNQMKSIVSEVVEEPMKTESGRIYHVRFGYKSVADRIVNSVDAMGTAAVNMETATERMIAAYRS